MRLGSLRAAAMFALGAAGFLHELFLTQTERPFLLTASLALMGLPFVISADKLIRGAPKEEVEEEDRWSHLP